MEMTSTELHVNATINSTSDVATIWKTAVNDYERITGVQIQPLATVNDISGVISEINKDETRFKHHRHDGSKLDKFRSLVCQSLAPIEVLGNIVAQAIKTTFPPSEAIFVAVRHLISTANAVSADYDRIAGFFEDLNSYLRRLKVLEHRVPDVSELKVALTEVFTSVLVLCAICTKHVRTKRIVKAFRSLVSGEDAELKNAYEHFHKMVQRERDTVRNATFVGVERLKLDTSSVHGDIKESLVAIEQLNIETSAIHTDTRKGLAIAEHINGTLKSVLAEKGQYLENQEVASERDLILMWLSSLDFHDKQRDTFAKHHEGTGKWLLDSDTFQEWVNSEGPATLWCPGIPGAGKTIMVSAAVSYVEQNAEGKQVAIAYVYCDYKDPKTRSEVGILSSITRQLAEQCNPIPSEVKAFREKYIGRRTHPSLAERISLISILARLFERTYIFVDALDECPEENREKFLSIAKELECSVRLLITTRPHVDVQARFPNLSRIDIVAHRSDIQAYLESKIDANYRMGLFMAKDPSLKADIIRNLRMQADGMFLLAHLQILHLCGQSSSKAVRKSLNTLSTGVYAFYEGAMERIEEQNEYDRNLARTALCYIFCARRPLNINELIHALSIDTGDSPIDETALPEIDILFSVSAGLIRVDKESGRTGFVHYTLQEYLEKYPEYLLPQPEIEMAKLCLRYLSLKVFRSGPCSDGKSLDQRLQAYCFLDYASHHWGTHIMANQSPMEMSMLQAFLEDSDKLASSIQVLHMPRYRMNNWYNRYPKQVTPLHVAAYWGLDKAIAGLLQGVPHLDSQDSHGATALQLAAQNGHTRVVELLLESGAKVNMINNRSETALAWASRNGHKVIVELLLQEGADILAEDKEGWTALHWAVMGGYNEVVKVLYSCYTGSDTNDLQRRHKALILAAEAGNNEMVQMLLDSSADIDWRDDEGSTALTFAVPLGHEKTVRTLLSNGADVNAEDNYLNVPLHWAIAYPTMTRLLLENGAKVDAKNNEKKTPLHWAAQEGQAEVLQILVQFGSDVNAKDEFGFTSLHAVALKGYYPMAQFLLENGANPNEKDEDGWTPLHAAVLKQHEDIVRLLVGQVENGQRIVEQMTLRVGNADTRAFLDEMADKKSVGSSVVSGLRSAANSGHVERVLALLKAGVDVDAEDKIGGSTALTIAAWLCLKRVVRVLLENGADVNKPDRSGRTALHHAVVNGRSDLVELLVESGADIDTRIHGWTALLLAAKNGNLQTADYLVRQGADVNAKDYYGRRALHWAARFGKTILVRLLIETGADSNAADHRGRTPLIWAVESRRHAVIQLLLELGADVTSSAQDGSTALHTAAYVGDEKAVFQLLASGAECDIKARGGLTALHVGAFMGYWSVVELLLRQGADASENAQWFAGEDNGDGCDDVVGDDVDEYLCNKLYRLLHMQEVADIAEGEARNSFNVQQLAAIGGNVAIKRLIEAAATNFGGS